MVEQLISQTEQQRLGQVLAPQMRQSLEVLQVPMMELRTLVQRELEQNPTIEEQVSEQTRIEVEPGTNEPEEEKAFDLDEDFAVLARLDEEWRDYFQQTQPIQRSSHDEAAAKKAFLLESLHRNISLQEHLYNQLTLSELEENDRAIGETLVGGINEDGYLTITLGELSETTGSSIKRLERILGLIQEFDPVGIGARDLKECLLLQLRRLGMADGLEAVLITDHMDALAGKRYQEIARSQRIPVEEIQKAARFVSTLEPKPGRAFNSDGPTYVLPDMVVQRVRGEYVVVMNDDQLPRVRISRHYRRLMEDAETSKEVQRYISDKIRVGAFLIKSIHQRQRTVERIAREIVAIQTDFWDHGVSRLKPLTMSEVARKLELHETTVSRAIAHKYMQTPRGLFEMKYFFTSGYQKADGESVSNKSVMDAMQRIIDEENPAKPLSDQAIAEQLKRQGFNVARRTIAKYREDLKILPSYLRKVAAT